MQCVIRASGWQQSIRYGAYGAAHHPAAEMHGSCKTSGPGDSMKASSRPANALLQPSRQS